MTGWRVTVDAADAERRLRRIRLGLTDLRAFWPRVTSLFIGWEAATFNTEGGFGGQGWAQLSADYAAWKARHYPGRKILSRTGALRRAATTPRRSATPMRLVLSIEPYMVDGRTVEPGWFQAGTPRMPARPLIFEPLPAAAEAALMAAAEQYVAELISRA